MRTAAAILAATVGLGACGEPPLDDDRPRVDGEACYLVADLVVQAWEAYVGPLSPRCRAYLDSYAVAMMPRPEVEHECGGDGGCAVYRERAVYVWEGADEGLAVNIAAHEWTHVLGQCTGVDTGNTHENRTLWGDWGGTVKLREGYDTSSVVGWAQAHASVGPCD